jgi:hypothetical protein
MEERDEKKREYVVKEVLNAEPIFSPPLPPNSYCRDASSPPTPVNTLPGAMSWNAVRSHSAEVMRDGPFSEKEQGVTSAGNARALYPVLRNMISSNSSTDDGHVGSAATESRTDPVDTTKRNHEPIMLSWRYSSKNMVEKFPAREPPGNS